MKFKKNWFEKCNPAALCRVGGNGPFHESQRRGLLFVNDGESLLDVGCGSATTLEAILKWKKNIKYKGVDFTKKHIDWCQKNFPDYEFEPMIFEELEENDQSWDVVWSRHVIDHCAYYEKPILEMIRIAKKRAIIILWYSFTDTEDIIKNINDQGEIDENSYLNQYNRKKFINFLNNISNTRFVHFETITGEEIKGNDTLIVLDKL